MDNQVSISRAEAEAFLATIESDLAVWSRINTPVAKGKVELLRYYKAKFLKLIEHETQSGSIQQPARP